jgi:hypothetical protein
MKHNLRKRLEHFFSTLIHQHPVNDAILLYKALNRIIKKIIELTRLSRKRSIGEDDPFCIAIGYLNLKYDSLTVR